MGKVSPEELVARIIDRLEPGLLVGRYVLIAEVLNPEGNGTADVWVTCSKGIERRDIFGLLTEAMEMEKADHLRDRLNLGE